MLDIEIKNITSVSLEEKEVIQKLKKFVNNTYPGNSPHRNIILTGIDKINLNSLGTFFNHLDNFQFIDGEINNVSLLPKLYYEHRKKVLNCTNKFKIIDEDVIIALNVNLFYLAILDKEGLKKIINDYGYRIIVILRDPILTIFEWNQLLISTNTPEAMVMDNKLHPMWKSIHFNTKNKIDRLAIIWELCANFYWNFRNIIKIYTYEQISYCSNKVIKDLCDYLILPYPENINKFQTVFNKNNNHFNLDEIKESVEKYCPTRLNYGYGNLDASIPGVWDIESIIFCRSVIKI